MRYATVCSGIEAPSVAWAPLGWRPVFFSEIEPFPCAVLAHHHPDVPNLGDMTRIHEHEVFRGAALDLLAGGTPCQAFSVAGLRRGLADPRGNLALVFLALADSARPRWVVWENVPGVLSSNEGRDLGAFLGALGELGYGFAYRVLDAQYFGVAQRRRRVFVVGHLGDWRRAAAVLFERDSLQGDPAPSRAPGAGVTGALMAGADGRGYRCGADEAAGGMLVARALTAHNQRLDGTVETLVFDPTQITHPDNRSNPAPGDPCHTLPAHGAPPAVALGFRHRASASDSNPVNTEAVPALRAVDDSGPSALVGAGVRRLTPRECERLQGFPDDYTLIPHRGKPAADGPRYKALGNSMAVPVMAWIGRRIAAVDLLG